ncbi:hypothetical protein CYMTET_54835 [Cymbomonas tetramitiformis]|uniref:XRCC4 coiled-coil domain-containing protein n=1 Tax=Cymbomonas tetramitiformis TaxID=36881 RepID=A0AAE0EP66_9CHLO|nr:hypothetical protein CYMTET_54835 [Cymbomonas tetramitiformis]
MPEPRIGAGERIVSKYVHGKAFHLFTRRNGESFAIWVTDGNNAWWQEGIAAPSEGIIDKGYWLDLATKALTTSDLDGKFEVRKVDESDGIELVWHSQYDADFLGSVDIACTTGKLGLVENDADVTSFFLETLASRNSGLENEVVNLKMVSSRALDDLQDAQNQLKCLADIKDQVEHDLFDKFYLLLNSKKRKIAELLQEIQELKAAKTLPPPSDDALSTDNESERRIGEEEEEPEVKPDLPSVSKGLPTSLQAEKQTSHPTTAEPPARSPISEIADLLGSSKTRRIARPRKKRGTQLAFNAVEEEEKPATARSQAGPLADIEKYSQT